MCFLVPLPPLLLSVSSTCTGVRTLVPLNPDELDTQFEAEIDANMFRHILENLLFRRYSEDQVKAKAHNAVSTQTQQRSEEDE